MLYSCITNVKQSPLNLVSPKSIKLKESAEPLALIKKEGVLSSLKGEYVATFTCQSLLGM